MTGEISIPPSKSISHRALILAAFSDSGSRVDNLLESEDTLATLDSLAKMGAEFYREGNSYVLTKRAHHGGELSCDNSGTTLRLLTGVASLFDDKSTLMGDASLNKRPMGPLLDALTMLGADISSTNGFAPVFINGGVSKNYCEIKGSTSSQFVSSLMTMAALRVGIQTRIDIIKPIVSKPYIDLTEKMLLGAEVPLEKTESDEKLQYTINGRELGRNNFVVPSDYSSAAFFIVAGALKNNQIHILGMSDEYPQADSKIIQIIEKMGGKIRRNNGIEISSSELQPMDINIADAPDLFPILVVLASLVRGEIKIGGAHHLKFKETDRIKTMTQVLRKMGVQIEPTPDGAIISSHSIPGGVEVDSYGDHRIAMAASIAATLADNPVTITNASCVDVSYPGFFGDLKKLGGNMIIDKNH